MSLYLDWNLGLGDAIICNGLVRELAKRHSDIILPCWERNKASLAAMFSDVPEVRLIVKYSGSLSAGADIQTLSIGLNHPRWGAVEPFDRAFYEFAGVDFDCRWSSFHVPDFHNPIIVKPRYGILHDDRERGFSARETERDRIIGAERDLMLVTPGPGAGVPITGWIPALAEAEEIHCIDSAFLHLTESVPTRGRLFFHKYARSGSPGPGNVTAVLRKDWKVIE